MQCPALEWTTSYARLLDLSCLEMSRFERLAMPPSWQDPWSSWNVAEGVFRLERSQRASGGRDAWRSQSLPRLSSIGRVSITFAKTAAYSMARDLRGEEGTEPGKVWRFTQHCFDAPRRASSPAIRPKTLEFP